MTAAALLARLAAAALGAQTAAPGPEPPPPSAESAPEPAPPGLETQATGYLDSRFTRTETRADALLPADDVPAWANLTELNLQVKLRWPSRALALVDASFIYQRGWGFPGPERDVPALRPLAVLSEVYASYDVTDHLHLTVGKKRVVWGPGLTVNPTDLLNPPKDPTDPAFQRAGAWLARLEAPYERFTITALAAARALRTYGGVPTSLVFYPDHPNAESVASQGALPDDRDDRAHYALALRAYALVADTDLNLVYVFTNRYQDAFESKSRLGASASRLVGDALEVHAEALVQRGTTRPLSGLEPGDLVLKAIAGPRYTFGDDSMLGLEYFYSGDGYTDEEFAANLTALAAALAMGLRPSLAPAGRDPGAPQKLTFDPWRRHYVFATYMKPRIRDDFTVQATAFFNLHDFTGMLAPFLVWSARHWLQLTIAAFVPLPGLSARKVDVDGRRLGEADVAPVGWRALASARVFY
jgi:hypothetical protein